MLERLGITAPLPLSKMASIVLAIDDGLSRQQWVSQEAFDPELFIEAMEFLLRAAVLMNDAPPP